ncbi:hypothetical protein LZ24_03399 [Desulfobotulus alkaliphilus]|uniref:DUF1311 domain-containing protein n=2 Tax=Desulfobotulus alkaliphilus TaxID=622671 RepID=A0A562QZ37_9BACT|nr:hypothetical protein LZ24_03399 [Desulfobotulus alkaliphilus]
MKTLKIGLVMIVLACGITTLSVQAASFNCSREITQVEKMICDNPKLSKLDEDLDQLFGDILRESIKKRLFFHMFKGQQSQWEREERNACADAACLKAAYTARIGHLRKVLATMDGPAPLLPPRIDDGPCLKPDIDWRNYEWVLIRDGGKASCQDMLAYLKSRPKDAPPPVCAEERLPPNDNWTRPKGEEVTGKQLDELLAQMPTSFLRGLLIGNADTSLKITRTDITRDGIPETLLSLNFKPKDCQYPIRCAVNRPDQPWHGTVALGGGERQVLLPMDEAGKRIDWNHRALTHGIVTSLNLSEGELVYYRGEPYWLSTMSWCQYNADTYDDDRLVESARDTNNHHNRSFTLGPVVTSHSKGGYDPSNFNEVNWVIAQDDPYYGGTCYFGYFHRDHLKIDPPIKLDLSK